jgi:hypothetical protein
MLTASLLTAVVVGVLCFNHAVDSDSAWRDLFAYLTLSWGLLSVASLAYWLGVPYRRVRFVVQDVFGDDDLFSASLPPSHVDLEREFWHFVDRLDLHDLSDFDGDAALEQAFSTSVRCCGLLVGEDSIRIRRHRVALQQRRHWVCGREATETTLLSLKQVTWSGAGAPQRDTTYLFVGPGFLRLCLFASDILSNDKSQGSAFYIVLGVVGLLLSVYLWWGSNVTTVRLAQPIGDYARDCLGLWRASSWTPSVRIDPSQCDRVLSAIVSGANEGAATSEEELLQLQGFGPNLFQRTVSITPTHVKTISLPVTAIIRWIIGAHERFVARRSNISYVASRQPGTGMCLAASAAVVIVGVLIIILQPPGAPFWINFIAYGWFGLLFLVAIIWIASNSMRVSLGVAPFEGVLEVNNTFAGSDIPFGIGHRKRPSDVQSNVWSVIRLLGS